MNDEQKDYIKENDVDAVIIELLLNCSDRLNQIEGFMRDYFKSNGFQIVRADDDEEDILN